MSVILLRRSWRSWCGQLTVVGAAPTKADLHVLKDGRRVRAVRGRQVPIPCPRHLVGARSRQLLRYQECSD